jgi:F-type H+-transporting ATPase subunit epsilon
MGILVDIVTPERRLLSEEVDMVTLPGSAGQMGVLRGHAPLLSTLDIGEIVLHNKGQTRSIAVHGGVVEVRPYKVTVLADLAESAEDIDIERADAARQRAQKSLEERQSGKYDPEALASLRRNLLRLKIARKRRTQRAGPRFEGDTET